MRAPAPAAAAAPAARMGRMAVHLDVYPTRLGYYIVARLAGLFLLFGLSVLVGRVSSPYCWS